MLTLEFDGARGRLKGDLTPHIEAVIKRALSWEDESIKVKNSINKGKKWYTELVATKHCYDSNDRSFPTGLIHKVHQILKSYKVDFEVKRLYNKINVVEAGLPDWAYDHQREANRLLLKHKRGLIQSPTGSGKTFMIAFAIQNFPDSKVLVIVSSINLLNNVHRTLEKYLGEPVGKIGDSEYTIKRVTVGINKSLILHSNDYLKEYLESIDVLLADEAHHCGAQEIQKVSNACKNTAIRMGYSATLKRKDGSDPVLEGMFGPILLKIPEEDMIKLGVVHPPKVRFVKVPDKKRIDVSETAAEKMWRGVYEVGIIDNEQRNNMICRIAHAFMSQPAETGAVLILIKNKKHGKKLERLLMDIGTPCHYIDGDVKGALRQRVLDAYRSGGRGLNCLISTCILDEGEDVPRIELVINGAGGPGERQVIQRIGRGIRLNEDGPKDRAIFIDFFDEINLIGHKKDLLQEHTQQRMTHVSNRYPGRVEVCAEKDLGEVLIKKEQRMD